MKGRAMKGRAMRGRADLVSNHDRRHGKPPQQGSAKITPRAVPDPYVPKPLPLYSDRCRCGACGAHFNSTYTFDEHRVGRACLTWPAMQARGFRLNADGWIISKAAGDTFHRIRLRAGAAISPYPVPTPRDTPRRAPARLLRN